MYVRTVDATQMRADEAEALVRNYRLQLQELQADFEAEKRRTFDIVADMTRQYKLMQHNGAEERKKLEREIQQGKDELAEARRTFATMERRKDNEIAQRDAEIVEHKKRMEQVGDDFTKLLQETMKSMSSNLEIMTTWSQDKINPLARINTELSGDDRDFLKTIRTLSVSKPT